MVKIDDLDGDMFIVKEPVCNGKGIEKPGW